MQCDRNQVLVGSLIPSDHVVGYYFAGLVGLAIAFPVLAGIILSVYIPGGVQYAGRVDSSDRGKESTVTSDVDISRQHIEVKVRHLGFRWTKTSLLTRGRTDKQIVRGVSAVFPSGKVTAILRPSGAGKSTFLQLLASRRLNPGFGAEFSTQGEVLFNGQPVDRPSRSQVAFVEQEDDYHLPTLTVRETLRYAAILRLPRNMSRKYKIARAEEVMKMLRLDLCADNLVGGELLKGISGGEKRRLSLAMINDTAMLIVDEPTSGLDALTANNVMTALNSIARSGCTVILSIHQPRSDIYADKLDNIVLLVKGGQVVFAGPRNEVEGTFTLAGYPIPPLYNPADWLLDVASVDSRGTREAETRARITKLVEFWTNLQYKSGDVDTEKPKSRTGNATVISAQEKLASMCIALPLIVERMTRDLWRQQAVFWVRLQQLPFLGLLFLLFYQRWKHRLSSGQDRIGYSQEMVSPVAFVGLLNCTATFPKDQDFTFMSIAQAQRTRKRRSSLASLSSLCHLKFCLLRHKHRGRNADECAYILRDSIRLCDKFPWPKHIPGFHIYHNYQVKSAYDAAARVAPNFKLSVSLDMNSLACGSTTNGQYIINNFIAPFQSHSQQYIYNSKMFFSTFVGQQCSFGQGSAAAGRQWLINNAGTPIYFIPNIQLGDATQLKTTWNFIDGYSKTMERLAQDERGQYTVGG
ncbi:hypothetical protein FS749_016600 [Ceratobasidium sp. UAMH 11750]|nr:hypothetical protein FS749_016600 [Ceratobasidium sp. UAMH 11750]